MLTDTIYVYTERSSPMFKILNNQYKFRKMIRKWINKFMSFETLLLPTRPIGSRRGVNCNISKHVHLTTCYVGFSKKKNIIKPSAVSNAKLRLLNTKRNRRFPRCSTQTWSISTINAFLPAKYDYLKIPCYEKNNKTGVAKCCWKFDINARWCWRRKKTSRFNDR